MAADRAIGIAGSAGAIQALKTILAALPADLPAPVFVVVHVGAQGRNFLASMFDAAGPLPVTTADDGVRPQNGHVYVAPADRHMLVVDATIRLGRGPRENLSRPAIDPLFRSLGLSYGSGAIGVLLSGYLNDGAAGIADLKRCGGVTVVQNPTDAEVPSMPLAALQASDVDHRAPVAEIAELLTHLMAADPPPAVERPSDIALEVDIALGRKIDSDLIVQIGDPVPMTCPACSGVLSKVRNGSPVRFRCQVGHAYTGEILEKEQVNAVDEAVRVALRIIEERATLAEKLAEDARQGGRHRTAETYDERVREYRAQADVLRRAATGE